MEISEPITDLINQAKAGNQEARTKLWNIVWPILRDKADGMLKDDRVGGFVRPSDVVQGAMLQLLVREPIGWNDRKHLFGFAVMVMRNIITDIARRRFRDDRLQAPLDDDLGIAITNDVSWVAVNEALTQLEAINAERARAVEMRAYGGLTNEEIAEHLEISISTVKRHMKIGGAFILSRLRPDESR